MIREEPIAPNNPENITRRLGISFTELNNALKGTSWLVNNNPLNQIDKTVLANLFPNLNIANIFPGGEPIISITSTKVINEWLEQNYPVTNAYLIKLIKRFPAEDEICYETGMNAKIEEWVLGQNNIGAYRSYFAKILGEQIDDFTLTTVPPKPICYQDLPYLDSNIRYVTDIVTNYPAHFFPPVLNTSLPVANYYL